MKNLIVVIAVLFAVSAKAQITSTTNADGTKSAGYSVQLKEPTTTVTSQVNFEYPPGMQPEPIPIKKGANNKTYITVVNESTPDLSKFEIDIFSGHKKLSKATGLVWLSVTSANKEQLSNGNYKYSDKNPSERENYKFSGSVKVGSVDVPITGGTFQLNSWDKRIVITYNLTLKNGVKTTGKYDTNYQIEDRSEVKVRSGIAIIQH